MKWYEAAGIGIIMAALYGLILWASIDGLSLISFFNYGDRYYMPLRITACVMFFAFLILFSVPIWYPFVENWIFETGERLEAQNKQREREMRRKNSPDYSAAIELEHSFELQVRQSEIKEANKNNKRMG